ncbi:bifunctional pyr operon transcriptional regulator/uracil phosphoribosyltransferase PyrR [Desulfovibrio sp. OttesenSCG-928-A18]|nr:bifunctional pyr operon transcriptional regulator/uracil phosphoribosyltransferase PyrR [Desulfovibrio sp. OttesenSCG-928-A18]
MLQRATLMTAEQMAASLDSLAETLLSRYGASQDLALVGIQRRGVVIAARLRDRMEERLGRSLLFGSLDITLYRDDWTSAGPKPSVGQTRIRFDVEGKHLILIDDVLFTGRTTRAALEALSDFGRPSKVELLVLVDRGHRELPIHPDYIGLRCETARNDRVDVLVHEIDKEEAVYIVTDS